MRSPVTWIIVLGVAVAGGAFILWRNRSKPAADQGTADATPAATDQVDYSGQIATLQEEIMDLQSTFAQGQGSGGGTTPPPATPPPSQPPAGPPAKPKVPAMPLNVRGSATNKTSIRLTWGAVSGATSYKVRVTYQGKLAASETVSHPYANVGGLTPNHTYTAHVAACNSSGCSAETNGPAVKTPRT